MTLAGDHLEKRFFRVRDRRINLHVRRSGAFNQRYPILFRDYLRATPAARDAYGEIKKQLARYFLKMPKPITISRIRSAI